MDGANIFDHSLELWTAAIGIAAVAAAWGEMRMKVNKLSKENDMIKAALDNKTDLSLCILKHGEQKESLQMVLSTIQMGNKQIREDIRHINDRLDTHIAMNGKS